MSCRTVSYRTSVLSSKGFLENLQNKRRGKYKWNTNDNNFITRFLVGQQWKAWVQYQQECELEIELENNAKFVSVFSIGLL